MICHVMGHMMFSWDHVPVSQDHVGVSSSLLSGYSLALGLGWVDLGVSRMIPSRGGVARAKPATTSSACEGVRPDMCGCRLRGRPVGSRKCHLFVFLVPWTAGWMPVWMTGVEERGVVSSRSAANKGEEMSGQVRLDGGLCRATKSTLRVGNVSLTGPLRLNEITSVKLLLPRRSPSNSAS